MKGDWDRLMKDYESSSTVLVADVDCTAEGKPLCDSNGVKGFPSIKHGDPASLEDYKGGRKYDDLAKFAKTLKPLCSPSNIDLCDETQKAEIAKIQAMPSNELDQAIAEAEKKVADAEAAFKKGTDGLQSKYKELQATKKKIVDGVKGGDVGMMKKVAKDNKTRPKCRTDDTKACSDKEVKFIEKMKAATADARNKQITRLEKMKGNAMKEELRLWLLQRLNILRQLEK